MSLLPCVADRACGQKLPAGGRPLRARPRYRLVSSWRQHLGQLLRGLYCNGNESVCVCVFVYIPYMYLSVCGQKDVSGREKLRMPVEEFVVGWLRQQSWRSSQPEPSSHLPAHWTGEVNQTGYCCVYLSHCPPTCSASSLSLHQPVWPRHCVCVKVEMFGTVGCFTLFLQHDVFSRLPRLCSVIHISAYVKGALCNFRVVLESLS